jgi:hypothetical protein
MRKAGRKRLDPGGATPFGDELLAPGVILACLQRVRIILGPATFGQRAEQDEASHKAGLIDREFDARRPAFRCPKQDDAT